MANSIDKGVYQTECIEHSTERRFFLPDPGRYFHELNYFMYLPIFWYLHIKH